MTTLHVALTHAQRGRPVFPLHTPDAGGCSCRRADCASPGKHPRVRQGLHAATCDDATIRGWAALWPDCRWGMVTGTASGVAVLDVDPRHGGADSLHALEAEHGALPATLTVQTPSGGTHIYWRDPRGLRPSAGVVGPGLDVRADSSYVVAIGCAGYHVDEATAPAAVPDWLLVLMRGRPAGANGGAPAVPDAIPEGGRRAALLSLAGSLRRRGLTADEMVPCLLTVNAGRCRPPLPGSEVAALTADAERRWHPDAPLAAGPTAKPVQRPAALRQPAALRGDAR